MASGDAMLRIGSGRGTRDVRLSEYLDAGLAERAERDANQWIKALRTASVSGQSFRDRYTHRGDSLWWFAELYFHKMQVVNRIFRTILALEALVAAEQPAHLMVVDGDGTIGIIGAQIASRHGIGWTPGRRTHAPGRRSHLAIVLRAHAFVLGARVARWRARRAGAGPRGGVLAIVHAAFWRGDEEQYIGPILQRLTSALPEEGLALVGVGPHTSYRARSWRQRVKTAAGGELASSWFDPVDAFADAAQLAPSGDVWRSRHGVLAEICASADLRRHAVILGCDAWPLLRDEFAGVAYLQFPWSAYVMDQLGAALDALQPRTCVTYAEAGGWGRALVLEARRRQIPTVGLQHGFIYRHWLNYLHEPDEMQPSPGQPADRGFPCPTRTLLYDTFAAEHLRQAGHFPADSLVVTGSARLDALAAASAQLTPGDLDTIRAAVGARPGQHVVLVAAKFTQIRRVFPALVEAVAGMPDVRLVVKCHPAETGEPYLAIARGRVELAVAPAAASLAALTRVASVLVTVNSTAAIEAMVLDVPSLVLSLPNNLSPFVEHGVMAGVLDGAPIAPALRALLTDDARRSEMRELRQMFMARYGIGSDGRSAERAAAAILPLTGAAGPTGGVS